MQIAGRWLQGDDGVVRPVVTVNVGCPGCQTQGDYFLVDSGSDRTVFSRDLLYRLRASHNPAPANAALLGIGGRTAFVMVDAVLEMAQVLGQPATIRGVFAAFTEPDAIDMSILGRDVLDNFDVIISRRRNEVLLLAPNHQYQVIRV
jgi:hypothetical protein